MLATFSSQRTNLGALIIAFLAISANSPALAEEPELQLQAPSIVHQGEEFTVHIQPKLIPPTGLADTSVELNSGSHSTRIQLEQAISTKASIKVDERGEQRVVLQGSDGQTASATVRSIPGWWSVLPPLVAIGLALWLKSVIPSLFLGLWIGVLIQKEWSFTALFSSAVEAFEKNIATALGNADHVAVILFSCMIGGMVSMVSSNGGMQGVINIVIQWANTARRGQLAVWFLGLAIFFDDYTNTMVVGNSVRSVTDRLKISRQKLAYLVDSTAAPVACVALITTWIGYEVSLIGEAIDTLEGFDEPAYTVFLNSLAYSFYPFMALFFVFLIAASGKDFGPMYKAERRSYQRTTSDVDPAAKAASVALSKVVSEDIPMRAINAVLPIVALVVSCVAGLFISGEGDNVQDILSTANAYQALLWGSFVGCATALVLTLSQRLMSLEEMVEAWMQGVLVMVQPVIILILAWALSDITDTLDTAQFLVRLGGDSLSAETIPAWTFLLSAAAAFATGSSWGVMAIVLPLILPVAWAVMTGDNSTGVDMAIIYSTVACVLAGAVWGDHCSPISDTTVLSSMAADCDHIEHVRTQLPYALLVGIVCLAAGTIPAALGVPWWVSMISCALILAGVLKVFGKTANQ